jgi:isopentenyl diphosphate isomerase/L-lactate dehydrogenase-like FMN-dependent dehydrogenase
MTDLSRSALNIFDLRDMARCRLPKGLFDFIDHGCEDDIALRNNRAALERIKLRTRVLNDISGRSLETTLFGQPQKLPIAIGPTGPAGLMCYRGEITIARAAAKAGIPFTLASSSTTAMETVVRDGGGRQWFQLYMWRDRERSYRIVERAKAAGFEALVVTVDSVVPMKREADVRNDFTIPVSLTPRNVVDLLRHPRWLAGVVGRHWLTTGMLKPENFMEDDPNAKAVARPIGSPIDKNDSLTWEDLRILRDKWPRKLIVKGILNVPDAVSAADYGADGIVVSNHGGVVCDSALAPIDALEPIVGAVGSRLTVLVDSGYRRGSDIIKALALGAKGVLIGRATLYGAAAAGEAGADRAIDILRDEMQRTLAVLGCTRIGELRRDHVVLPSDQDAAVNAPEAATVTRIRGEPDFRSAPRRASDG